MDKRRSSSGSEARILAGVAGRLNAASIASSSRPYAPFALALMTDPRIQDLEATIRALPVPTHSRTAVIFRHYEADNRSQLAQRLGEITTEAGHLFLVAGDVDLALSVQADGIHFPEYSVSNAAEVKRQHPKLILSAACHTSTALQDAKTAGASCALISPVFPTSSHPDATPLGLEGLRCLIQKAQIPVLALGGINSENAALLESTGAAGIAAVSALSK